MYSVSDVLSKMHSIDNMLSIVYKNALDKWLVTVCSYDVLSKHKEVSSTWI